MKKGFTLVELSVALVLLGVTMALGYRLLFYTQSSFDRNEDRYSVQQNVQVASELITRELQKATGVEILNNVPDTFNTNKRYLYVDLTSGKLKQVINGIALDALGGITSDVSFDAMKFKRHDTDAKILQFEIAANSGSQIYSTASQIKVLNLPNSGEINIDDIITLANGKVLCYTLAGNAKSLDLFAIRTEHNPGFAEPFQIENPPYTITWWFTPGTDLSKLKAYFEYSGESIKVNGVNQISGVTVNDFRHPVVYTITAEDGSTVDYTVELKELEGSPPEAAGVKIKVINTDPDILIPYESSTLTGVYTYIPNGNGAEGSSQYQWLVSDSEDGTYAPIPGKNTISLKPSGLAGKWVKFGVRPIAINGVPGQYYYSSPKQIYPDNQGNLFWKHFINDLYIMRLPESERPEDFTPSVYIRQDYTVESKMDPDQDNLNLTISYPNSAGSTVSSGGSHIYKDLSDYVNDLSSFSITIDAQVKAGSGYGVLLYGAITDSKNNKDTGFMFQFDPGWNGFLIRKIENGKHDPWWRTFGVTKNRNMADNENGHKENGRYTPQDIRNSLFRWPNDSTSQDIAEWQKRYKTELILQKQLDGSLIFKATVIDENGNRSNEMWFGDFGTYTTDIYNKNGTRTGTKTFYGKEIPQLPASGGTMLGLRTWDAGGSSYRTEFQEVILGPGFEMNITESEFISDKQIKVRFDQALGSSFDLNRIKYGSSKVSNAELINDAEGQAVLLTLSSSATQNEIRYGADSKLNIERGGIKQLYAGDVKINNGLLHDVDKDSTVPTVSSIIWGGNSSTTTRRRINITFSENIDRSTATTPSNYKLRDGLQPTSITVVNDTTVQLNFSRNINTSSDRISIKGIKDIAGNTMAELTDSTISR